MGLFFKKKEEKKEEPPLFKFPELPKKEFPTYEAKGITPKEVEEIREAVKPEDLGIPKREPLKGKMLEKAEEVTEEMEEKVIEIHEEKESPLFVKIDEYKEAMRTLKELKSKLGDAEKILAELSKLRVAENSELENWKKELEEIKEKLLTVDKKLFEI